jgi:hypothetical protein
MEMSDLYETDFALWSERRADALRRRAGNEIDEILAQDFWPE